MTTSSVCDNFEPENWQALSPDNRKELLSDLVNDVILEPRGYANVPVEIDDPADPKCGGDPACFLDDDKKIVYDESVVSGLPAEKAIELLAHEALHAIDNEDFGSSKTSDLLGDEVADHHTTRFDWPPGAGDERGETHYEHGEIIPGLGHVDEVYIPAEQIAQIVQQECDKAHAKGQPLSIESLKRRIQDKLRKLLKERWKPKPASKTSP